MSKYLLIENGRFPNGDIQHEVTCDGQILVAACTYAEGYRFLSEVMGAEDTYQEVSDQGNHSRELSYADILQGYSLLSGKLVRQLQNYKNRQIMQQTLTLKQAYKVMFRFINDYYYRHGNPEDIGNLLSDIQPLSHFYDNPSIDDREGKDILPTVDPASWYDWIDGVNSFPNNQTLTLSEAYRAMIIFVNRYIPSRYSEGIQLFLRTIQPLTDASDNYGIDSPLWDEWIEVADVILNPTL